MSRTVIDVIGKPFSLQVRIDFLLEAKVTTASFLLLLLSFNY